MDMDKYFEELNDMANLKGFGEKKAVEYDITDYLKDDKELQKEVIKEFLDEIAELKTENEMLKERVETLDKMTGIFSARLANKYKSCLQEIKEMCKEEVLCDDCELQGTNKCDARMCTNFYLNDFADEILQKISEVME